MKIIQVETILKQLDRKKVILFSVVVLALLLILVLLISDQSRPVTYDDKDYPVTVKSQKGGGLKITLNGSIASDIPWIYEESPEDTEEETPIITYKAKTSSGSKITFYVTPHKSGYGTIHVSKSRTINEIEYPVANIYLDVVVSESEKGYIATLASADERTVNGKLGASNTDQPYYITGNEIHLPALGDWELLDTNTLEAEDENIAMGVADNGSYYYRVYLADGEASKDLLLKSESLNQEIRLKAVLNENNRIVLE